jgi:hypothetical protein
MKTKAAGLVIRAALEDNVLGAPIVAFLCSRAKGYARARQLVSS